jgi:hypothetical protein
VVAGAVVLGGVAVVKLRGAFGSEAIFTATGSSAQPLEPTHVKQVTYEVYGPADTSGSVSYLDKDAKPEEASFTGLPWTYTITTWQHMLGLDLNWIAPVFGLIILLAVGSDYNLLLVSRFQEEIGAGLQTGIIRSMGETGGVVTSAGLVFAFTMMSMAASDLSSIGQAGTTIGLGLLFDTLIVRSFMTPSIAALLGRWFWWPLKVRPRPASQMLRPFGPRRLVRSLLLGEDADATPAARRMAGDMVVRAG